MKSPILTGVFPSPPGPAILIHGGAWDIPWEETPAHVEGMRQAVMAARRLLDRGEPVEDVATAAIASMEESGTFDAGRGSVLTRNGQVEMDAGIMRGKDLAFGAVALMRATAAPIRAARALLDAGNGEVRLLAGPEADRFAASMGLEDSDLRDLRHPREIRRWEILKKDDSYHTSLTFLPEQPSPKGTVGCVVRDGQGRVAAATSTGGTPFRPEGRVGDSPLPGAGYYADLKGGASATGWGEAITAAGLSGRAVADLDAGLSPETAIRRQLERMQHRVSNHRGEAAAGGLILMTSRGYSAWGYSTPRMARAGWSPSTGFWSLLEPAVGSGKDRQGNEPLR